MGHRARMAVAGQGQVLSSGAVGSHGSCRQRVGRAGGCLTVAEELGRRQSSK